MRMLRAAAHRSSARVTGGSIGRARWRNGSYHARVASA
jgi:hypothetical protein